MDGNDRNEVIYFGEVVPVTRIHPRASGVRDHHGSVTSQPTDCIVKLNSIEHYIVFACVKLRHWASLWMK